MWRANRSLIVVLASILWIGFSGTEARAVPDAGPDAGSGDGEAASVWWEALPFSLDANDDDVDSPHFGFSLAADGETLVVGAPERKDAQGTESGAVYVYTRDESIWDRQTRLLREDSTEKIRFGDTVAFERNTAIVGAPHADVGEEDMAGVVCVFKRVDGSWRKQQELRDPEPTQAGNFGNSLALDGETLVVGADNTERTKTTNGERGIAHVWTRSDDTWTHRQALQPRPDKKDAFGASVALDGETLVVGAKYDGYDGQNAAGSAYVYERTDGTWSVQKQLTPSRPQKGAQFGVGAALQDETLMVGAHREDGGPETDGRLPYAGAVYVFTHDEGTWTKSQRLATADPGGRDNFGQTLALRDDMAILGAPSNGYSTDNPSSYADIYKHGDGKWHDHQRLPISMRYSGHDGSDRFGRAIAVAGERIFVGAPNQPRDHLEPNGFGRVFAFKRSPDRDGDGIADRDDPDPSVPNEELDPETAYHSDNASGPFACRHTGGDPAGRLTWVALLLCGAFALRRRPS